MERSIQSLSSTLLWVPSLPYFLPPRFPEHDTGFVGFLKDCEWFLGFLISFMVANFTIWGGIFGTLFGLFKPRISGSCSSSAPSQSHVLGCHICSRVVQLFRKLYFILRAAE